MVDRERDALKVAHSFSIVLDKVVLAEWRGMVL